MDVQVARPLIAPTAERRWIAIMIGILAFWGFTGGTILNPFNLDWILSAGGDPAQHYLGWNFFRHEPFFQLPFGKNSSFGEALGSSIVYSDSIPLFAFPFRIFSRMLPDGFQYFGLWVLTCFILQSVFAWSLLARFTGDRALLALATAFFALSPSMLWRLHGHEALIGHWVILAALIIFLDDRPKTAKWALLAGVTCLVHAYLLAMVSAIWLTDVIRRIVYRQSRVHALLAELVMVVAVIGCMAWTAGYFVIGQTPGIAGFGSYRLNLLAPISPSSMWSVFGSTREHGGDYEGFSYLGAGIILLAGFVIAMHVANGRKITVNRSVVLPLAILSTGLLIYALSNRVAFGHHNLLSYSYPKFLAPLTGTFRVSGRFVWPVVYMFELALFALFFASVSRRRGVAVLSVLLLVQAVDLSKASKHFRTRYEEQWTSPLQSAFWSEVPKLYRRIAFVIPSGNTPKYESLALLASNHRMTINGGYFARVDPAKVAAVQEEMRRSVRNGLFRADTLYVFNDAGLWEQAIDRFDRKGFIGQVDGFNVVAPNYGGCRSECGLRDPESRKPYPPGSVVDFSNRGDIASYARGGWHQPEETGRWTDGHEARLSFVLDEPAVRLFAVQMTLSPFVAARHTRQRVDVLINGKLHATWELSDAGDVVKEIRVDAAALDSGKHTVELQLMLPDAVSPHSLGVSEDDRVLGVFMKTLKITAADYRG